MMLIFLNCGYFYLIIFGRRHCDGHLHIPAILKLNSLFTVPQQLRGPETPFVNINISQIECLSPHQCD